MRFDHFRQIVQRIRQEIPCPRCGTAFDDQGMDVVSASLRSIEFFAPCPVCGAVSSIFAQIEPARRVHQSIRPAGPSRKVSPEIVRDISDTIRKFQGSDVKELFK